MKIDYSNLTGVIHIGASTGQETHDSGINFYNSYNLNVLWIEPIPKIFEILKQNISLYPKQKAIQSLLTDEDDKEYSFNVSNNNGESSSILELEDHKKIWPSVHYVETLKLKSKTLSSIIVENNINIDNYDCITMDTQGSELMVLRGSLNILKSMKYVNMEVCDFPSYKNCCKLEEVDKFFEENGYKRVNLIPWKLNDNFDYYDALYMNTKK
jgi:FkbM family methyltransferase